VTVAVATLESTYFRLPASVVALTITVTLVALLVQSPGERIAVFIVKK